jgi:hypothetical protein
VERIRCEKKRVLQILQREVSGSDAVISGQNFSEDGSGTRVEGCKLRGTLQRFPTLGLRIALLRRGSAQSDDEHDGA